MMLDIIMCITFLPVKKIPSYSFLCQNFDNKWYIDNQKVQVAGEIKRDICKYLQVASDVADDA